MTRFFSRIGTDIRNALRHLTLRDELRFSLMMLLTAVGWGLFGFSVGRYITPKHIIRDVLVFTAAYGYLSLLVLLIGIALTILAIEAKGIWNLLHVETQSLDTVEFTHPYLPRKKHIAVTALLAVTLPFFIYSVAAQAQAVGSALQGEPTYTYTENRSWQIANDNANSDSMVLYWKFDETSAGTFADSSGGGQTGTGNGASGTNNTPQPSTSVPGSISFSDARSLTFDGTDDYVQSANNSGISGNAAFTMAAWVKINSTATAESVMGFGDGNVALDAASIYINARGAGVVSGEFSGGNPATSAGTALSTGTWYHLALTKTAGAINTTTHVYINGVDSGLAAGASTGTPNFTNDPIDAGKFANITGSFGDYFNGSIDDVRVYSRALSAAEVAQLAAGSETSAKWTGSTSTDYETAGNWDINAIPDPFTNIIVTKQTNEPVMTKNESGASVTIESGATLDLAGKSFTFNDGGALKGGGTLRILGSESIKNIVNSGTGTVLYYGTGSTYTGLAAGNTYKNLTINDGLIGYWKLDDGTGSSIARDSSGNGHNGTLTNGPTWSTSTPSLMRFYDPTSLHFDGVDDNVATASTAGITTNHVTVSCWLKPDVLTRGDLVNKWNNGAGAGDQFDLLYGITSGKPGFYISTGAGAVGGEVGSTAMSVGSWYNVTGSFDGTNVKVYLNGILQATGSHPLTLPSGSRPYEFGNNGFGDGQLHGSLDDIRIYNRALSANEIATLASGYPNTGSGMYTLGAALTVNGNLNIVSGGIDASSSNYNVTVGGNWSNVGNFTPHSDTVTLNGTNQTLSGSTVFYNFTKSVSAAASLFFDPTGRQSMSGALTMNGAASNLLSIRSTHSGTGAHILLDGDSGTQTLSYLDVKDSDASGGATLSCSNNCSDSGNNTNWSFATTKSITGKVYSDEGLTKLASVKVAVSVNGAPVSGTGTTDAGGQYTISGLTNLSGGSIITLYISGNTAKGVTVTLGSGSSMTGVNLYQDHLITRSGSGIVRTLTSNDLRIAEHTAYTDITSIFSVNTSNNVTVVSGKQLYIWTGSTLSMSGTLTTSYLHLDGNFNQGTNAVTINTSYSQSGGTLTGSNGGSNFIDNGTFTQSNGTFIATSGTGTFANTFLRTGGTWNSNGGSTKFNANTNFNITTKNVTFYNLIFDSPSASFGNTITLQDGFTVSNDLKVQNNNSFSISYTLQASGTPTITVSGNILAPYSGKYAYIGSATAGSNFSFNLAGNLTLNNLGTLYANVNFDGATNNQTISQSSAQIVDSAWTINKTSGVVFTSGAVATQTSSTSLTLDSASDIFSATGSSTLQLGTVTISAGTFTGASSSTTVGAINQSGGTWNSNGATLSSGTFTQSAGTFNAPTGTFAVSGTFDRTAGTFNNDNGTMRFSIGNSNYSITTGNLTFYDVLFNDTTCCSSTTVTLTDSFTVSDNLTDTSAATGGGFSANVITNNSSVITVGGNFIMNGSSTINSIFGSSSAGSNFTINLAGNFTQSRNLLYANINFDGTSNNQIVTQTAGSISGGNWTINKTSGAVQTSSSLATTNVTLTLDNAADVFSASGGSTLSFNTVTESAGVFTGASSTTTLSTINQSGGTWNSYGTTLTTNTFTQSLGTFTAPSGTFTSSSTFNRTGGTFNNNNGTMKFNASGNTYTITTGGATFYDVLIYAGGGGSSNTVTFADSFTIADNLTFQNQSTTFGPLFIGSGTPTITVNGNVVMNGSSGFGTNFGSTTASQNFTMNVGGNLTMSNSATTLYANINFDGTSNNQIVSKSAGTIGSSTWVINKTSGAVMGSGTLTTSAALTLDSAADVFSDSGAKTPSLTSVTISNGTFTSGSGMTVNTSISQSGGTWNSYGQTLTDNGTFTQSAGTFTAPTGAFITKSTFNRTGGTFNNNNGTMEFYAGGNTFTITTGGATFYDVLVYAVGTSLSNTVTFADNFTATDNLTVQNQSTTFGPLFIGSGGPTITVNGNMVMNGSSGFGTNFGSSTASQDFTVNVGGNLTMSNGAQHLYANTVLNGAGDQTITQTSGSISSPFWYVNKTGGKALLASALSMSSTKLTLSGGTLSLNGNNLTTAASGFKAQSGSTLRLHGGETVTAPILNTGSTVWYDESAQTKILKGYTYQNLVIGSTGSAIFNLTGSSLTVRGNLTLSGGTLKTTNGGTLSLSGSWLKTSAANAAFTAGTGTVVLNGGNQTMSGSTTFYNLTKSVSAAHSLTFAATTTQIISHALTLNGATGNNLSLRSSMSGLQANLNPQGTRTISYVDVKDNDNVNVTAIDCTSSNCTDSGNNTNWSFPVAGDTITGTVYSDTGSTTVIGSGVKVAVSLNGAAVSGTGTTDAGGQFSITGIPTTSLTGGTVVALYISGNTNKAVTVSTGSGGSMTGMTLIRNQLIVRSGTGTHVSLGSPVTSAMLTTAKATNYADITSLYSMSSNNLTITTGKTLNVWTGSTLNLGGTLTASYLHENGNVIQGNNAITVNTEFTMSGGTFTGSSGGSTMTIASYSQTSGTFVATNGRTTFTFFNDILGNARGFNKSGGTFQANGGTVYIAATGSNCHNLFPLSLSSTLTLNVLTINTPISSCSGNPANVMFNASGGTIVASGDFNFYAGGVEGSWEAKKNLIMGTPGGTDTTIGSIAFTGTGAQTYSFPATSTGAAPKLIINKSSGTVTPAAGTTTLTADAFALTAGSFTAPSGLFIIGRGATNGTNLVSASAGTTFNANGGTIEFTPHNVSNCTNANFTLNIATGSMLHVNNMIVNAPLSACAGSTNTVFKLGGTSQAISVDGRLTLGLGQIKASGSWFVGGDLAVLPAAPASTIGLTFTGTGSHVIQPGGSLPTGNWVIAKTSGSLTATGAISLNTSGQNLVLTGGTLNLNGNNLTVNKAFIIGTGTTLRLHGTETLSYTTLLSQSHSTIWYDSAGSSAVKMKQIPYQNVIIGSTGSTIFTPPNTQMNMSGALTISGGTLNVNGGQTLLLSGSWLHTGGTFTAGTGTVIMRNVAASVLTESNAFNNLTINDGLVGYWKLDDGTGSMIARDSSGNGNNGTLTNGPTWSTNTPSTRFYDPKSLHFDGVDDNVTMTNTSQLQIANGTVSAWIRTPNAGSSYRGIVVKANAYGIFLNSNVFELYDWTAATDRTTGVNLADNNWHHVTATFLSGVSNGTILYIDGVARLTTQMTIQNQNSGLLFGNNTVSQPFGGFIDDIRVYNRVLSASEVSHLAAGYPNSGSGVVTLGANLDVNGNLNLEDSTLDPTSSNRQINLAGNLLDAGSITQRNNNFILDGTNQTLSGSTTFWNFTKAVSSAAKLFFDYTSRQSFSGSLAMNGVTANLLSIRSTASGTGAHILLDGDSGTQTLSYLDVKDSDASGGATLVCHTNSQNCTNSGNNTNWDFSNAGYSITGTVYSDTGAMTPIGSGVKVGVSLNGAAVSGTGTTDAGGEFSITGVPTANLTGGTVVALYISGSSNKAVTVSTGSGGSMTGMTLIRNQLIVRSGTGTHVHIGSPVTSTMLTVAKASNYADITSLYSMSSNNMTVVTGKTLNVWTGSTLKLGGTLTASNVHENGNVIQGNNAVTVNTAFTMSGGTFTGSSGGTAININGSYVQGAGNFIATSGTLNIGTNGGSTDVIVFGTGSTFTHNNGTVVFNSTRFGGVTTTINAYTSPTFNTFNIIPSGNIGCATETNNLNGTIIVLGTFTYSDFHDACAGGGTMSLNTGTVKVAGNIIAGYGATGGSATIELNGTSVQTLSGSYLLPVIKVNKTAGSVSAATGTTDIFINGFKMTNGTFNGPTNLHLQGSLTLSGGTFNMSNSNLIFDKSIFAGTSMTISLNGSATVGNLTFTTTANIGCAYNTYTMGSSDTFVVKHNFLAEDTLDTCNQGEFLSNGTYNVQGNTTFNKGLAINTASFKFTGTGTQYLNIEGGTMPTGNFTIAKPSGVLTLSGGTLSLNTSGQNLVLTGGTLNLNGNNLTVNKAFIIGTGTTLRLHGTETLNYTNILTQSHSTIWYDSAGSSAVKMKQIPYQNVIIGSTGSTIFTPPNTQMNMSGALTISGGTLNVNGGQTLLLSGSWLRTGGAFTSGTGTVIMRNIAASVLTESNAFNNLTINDGLVGYWKLDDGTGSTIARDSSGNGNNGTITNGPTWSTNTPSTRFYDPKSLHFDGSNDYVNISDNTVLNPLSAITLSAWVKIDSMINNANIVSKSYTSAVTPYIEYSLKLSDTASTTNTYQLQLSINGTNKTITSASALSTGIWTHLIGTWDGTTMKIFKNGIADSNTNAATGNISSYSSPVQIGRWGAGSSQYFQGAIDDVRIYNRALSASEVAHLASGYPNSGSGIVTLGANLDVNGNLQIVDSTLDPTSSNRQINLAGNLLDAGSITQRNNNFILDGTNQTISGSTLFYNFTKSVSAAAKLFFDYTSRQSFSGSLAMNGAASNLLSIRSTSSGTGAHILLDGDSGTQSLNHLDVKDSDASGGATLVCHANSQNCTDSGNNTNWNFINSASATGSIIGYVWNDANGNGIRTGDEAGFTGITVTLSGATLTGALLHLTSATNSLGQYAFSGAIISDSHGYTISIDPSTLGGTYLRTTFNSTTQVLGTGAIIHANFGYVTPSTLTGSVFLDTNKNGIKESTETQTFSGTIVELSGHTGTGGSITLTTTTNASGTYVFQNLPTSSGSFVVAAESPTGYQSTVSNSVLVAFGTGGQIKVTNFGFELIPASSSSSSSSAQSSAAAASNGSEAAPILSGETRGQNGYIVTIVPVPVKTSQSSSTPIIAQTSSAASATSSAIPTAQSSSQTSQTSQQQIAAHIGAGLEYAVPGVAPIIQTLGDIQSSVSQTMQTGIEHTKNFTQNLSQSVQNLTIAASQTVAITSKSLSTTIGTVGQTIGSALQHSQMTAAQIASMIQSGASGIAQTIADGAQSTLQTMRHTSDIALGKIAELGRVGQTTAQFARTAGQSIADMTTLTIATTQTAVNSFTQTTNTITDATAIALSQTTLQIAQSITNTTDQTTTGLQDVGQQIADATTILGQNANELAMQTTNVSTQLGQTIAKNLSTAQQSVSDVTNTGIQWSAERIADGIGATQNGIGQIASSGRDAVSLVAFQLRNGLMHNAAPAVLPAPQQYTTTIKKDANGQTLVATLAMSVFDSLGHPYANTPVVLFSTPKIAVTNSGGIAVFHNVETGSHQLEIHVSDGTVEKRDFILEPPSVLPLDTQKELEVALPVIQVMVSEPVHSAAPAGMPVYVWIVIALLAGSNVGWMTIVLMKKRHRI